MLLAYIDEFGHVGPYISDKHPKFNTHPLFGYAGFVIPAENVRNFGGYFENLKSALLAYEIKRDQAHPRRWEKKGASLLTSRNHERYGDEISRTLSRLARKLRSFQGKAFFYGRVKPRGSASETGESSTERSIDALRQTVMRLAEYAHDQNRSLLIFMDSVDDKPRLDAVSAMGALIYAAHTPALRRIAEIPMQLESHLYGTTQYADWVCALMGRVTHHHLTSDSEFTWAPQLFREQFGERGCLPQSRVTTRRFKTEHVNAATLALDRSWIGDRYTDRDDMTSVTGR